MLPWSEMAEDYMKELSIKITDEWGPSDLRNTVAFFPQLLV